MQRRFHWTLVAAVLIGIQVLQCPAEDTEDPDDMTDEEAADYFGDVSPFSMHDRTIRSVDPEDSSTLETRKVKDLPRWARRYTASTTGCPCWFDLKLGNVCACCKGNARQCGYPAHNLCQRRKTSNARNEKGCPGVPNRRRTLSARGYPCLDDTSDYNCYWCRYGSMQCIQKSYASFAHVGCSTWGYRNCIGMPQDCQNNPSMCDPNASCAETGLSMPARRGQKWEISQCVCNDGFVGNGFQCANETTGEVTVRTTSPIKLDLAVASDIIVKPDATDSPLGSAATTFFDELKNLVQNGTKSCGDTCSADVATCGKI